MAHLLLKHPGIDINQMNSGSGKPPLWVAARRGQIPVLKPLLAGDTNRGTQGPQLTTPLMAVIYAHAVTVKSPMGVCQADPLNSQGIDLLKRAEELHFIGSKRNRCRRQDRQRLGDNTGGSEISG